MSALRFGKSFTLAAASGAPVSSAASPISSGVTMARMAATQGCWVTVTPAVTGAVVNSRLTGFYVGPTAIAELIKVSPGDIFNVILDGATAGSFNVTEVSH